MALRRPRPDEPSPAEAPDAPESDLDETRPPGALAPEDPDRVLRHRLVFALATLLIGTLFALFSLTVLAFALSGRLSLLFSAGAALLALGTLTLILRAPLRAACAWRPDSDELRSAAGLVSLACGALLLSADALFLLFTFTVLVTAGGPAVFVVLPLAVLSYFSYQFIREATDDFLKRIRLRRELRLFFITLGYFVFTGFVFVVLAAAATASPVTLVSPPNGSTVCPGTPLDFAVSDVGVSSATWDNGSGPQPLPSPFDINTTGWADGPYNLTITVSDNAGRSHASPFTFTMSTARPPCS